MNTQEEVINDLAIQLANKTIECSNYKAFYKKAQAQVQELQAQAQKEAEAQTEAQEQTEKEEQ